MTSLEEYKSAQKLAFKDAESCVRQGRSPYPDVLDDILKKYDTASEVKIGLVQIPIELIAGTKSAGRTNAFSKHFYPLLSERSEFGSKWMSLCTSHLEEGIRDPITAYEFLGKFYVEEGNKRVSVLHYFNAVSVPGLVTRIIPKRSDNPEIVRYFEYVNFTKQTGIYNVQFSEVENYAKLYAEIDKKPDELWSDDEIKDFNVAFTNFNKIYQAKEEVRNLNSSDAFLAFIRIFGYDIIKNQTPAEMAQAMKKAREELITTSKKEEAVELLMEPQAPSKKPMTLVNKLISSVVPSACNIAFVNAKTPETSSWTYGHELGRLHLEEVFGDRVHIESFNNVTDDGVATVLEEVIQEGFNVIFTTSSNFCKASLTAAVKHPEVSIFSCSLRNRNHAIRTYYGRMYEAKFLSGAIAGAMTENNKIGYIADYPIIGMTANINAFALGASMVNPRVKVYLDWSSKKDHDALAYMKENDIHYLSCQEMIIPDRASRLFGLIHIDDNGNIDNLAMSLWNWGKLYEIMVRRILNDTLETDHSTTTPKAVNYWWGMSTELIDVITSDDLPLTVQRLVRILKKAITTNEFNPFTGKLIAQNNVIVQENENSTLSPDEIIGMEWLAQNVIGSIPTYEELKEEAKPIVELRGIFSPEAK
ncbi:MAG: BMP family ABC transporter substrate-binding protein [Lachnospiraceae bacterium]